MDISVILTIITGLAIPAGGLVGRWILAGQGEIKKKIDDANNVMDGRVKAVEADTKTFLSKDDLEKKFLHEKNGRAAIEQASLHLIEKNEAATKSAIADNTEDIVKLREAVAKLEQNDTYLSKEVSSLTARMDKGFEKVEEKLDRITTCIAEVAKKVS